MSRLPRSPLSLGLAAGCVAAIALPQDVPARAKAPPHAAAAIADGERSPLAMGAMLARWDRMPASPERDRLALAIDAAAGQRHATVSRLFWYTDLAAARRAASALDRPILSLRMLGRLDEDLSCANSRFFRTTLYANAEVGKLLREGFVLHWSTERPVPRVTIDYGDGRKLERTTTGNSAHYVLDAAGRVVDVLPGLYAPAVFRAELEKSAGLARRVRKLDHAAYARAVAGHHHVEAEAAETRFASVVGTQYLRGLRGFGGLGRLLGRDEVDASAVARAQRSTITKMVVEVPELVELGEIKASISRSDVEAWAVVGQKLWGIYTASTAAPAPNAPARRPIGAPPAPPAPVVLDAPSRALVAQVHNAGPVKATPAELAEVIARLEQSIVADTALNELRLRPQIRGVLAAGEVLDFERLNAWIYAAVFETRKDDAWLGLLPRTDFTGLPGDGV
ncbi:MAG TPA: hypothetical protein VK932_29620, partial [Kofleriaceae bacterium]|nr:hypothetical protein [Kofleriaceae bacterium]